MLDNRLAQLALYAAVLVAAGIMGARWLEDEPAADSRTPAVAPIRVEDSERGRVTVHVAGAVREPGVYRLRADARVNDAVARAGGPTISADLIQVNLAAKVEDGRQVLLPEVPADGGRAAGGKSAQAAGAAPGVPLNLNTATLEELEALDGIGPAMAQQILDYREANNGFGTVDELNQVPGIGEKRLASLREQVRI